MVWVLLRIVEGIKSIMVGTKNRMIEIPQMVGLSSLHFDILNPRRTSSVVEIGQRALLVELYQLYDITDLLVSFSVNGYFSEEPLIAIPSQAEGSNSGEYTVVEGNRRLAALKILMLEEFRGIANPRLVPEISPEVHALLDPVPVKVYQTREEVLPYLGVRHIAGTKPWGALAKARYVARLVEAGESYTEVARSVGSGRRTDVVRKWLLTLYCINQANTYTDVRWDLEDQRFGFSWLYTSIGYRNVRDYLGFTEETYNNPHQNPVSTDYKDELISHMTDLYGPPPGNSRLAAVRESRQISDLATVYGNDEALATLRAGASLTVAVERTIDERGQLIELLRKADLNLRSANSIAPNHTGEEEAVQLAQRCLNTARALTSTLSG